MDINNMLDKAVFELQYLKIEERFTLKDLFKGYEWKRMTQGEKSTLGTLFLTYARTNEQIRIYSSSNNQKSYSLKDK